MKALRAALVLALAALPAQAPADPQPSLEVVHYRLDNGLEVVLQPDPTITTAVVHVTFRVGSKDEVAGKTGFAHLFEHLMFEGSAHVAAGEFDTLLEDAGGWNNGTTDNDATTYIAQLPANQLELALYLEADRMAGLWDAMNQGVLDNQRDVVQNERRERVDNEPYGRADEQVQQALWPPGHGNHNLTIGTMADLEAAELADVEAFWRTWYVPSNATLTVVGGIDVAATRKLVDRYFGWMPAAPRPAGRALDGPVAPRDGAIDLEATDDVEAAKVAMAWRTDVAFRDDADDAGVIAHLLGGGKTSRLYRRLVFRDRLATEVYAYQNDLSLGGELHIEAIVREGVKPEAVRDAIREEVARLRDEAPDAAEVERARRVSEASLVAGLENPASRAEAIAMWTLYTGDPDHLAEEIASLAAITPARLQATARRWLAADSAVTMIVRPADKRSATEKVAP